MSLILKPHVIITTCVLLLSLSIFSCFAIDEELKQCQIQCKKLDRSTEAEQVECKKECVKDYVRRIEKEQPTKKKIKEEEDQEDEVVANRSDRDDPWKEKERQCREECREGQSERAQRGCEKACLGRGPGRVKWEEKSNGFGGGGEGLESPYVFGEEDFRTTHEAEEGRIRVLERFSDRSELLRGVENLFLVVLEARPQTFILPAHFDADLLLFVAKGKGSVTTIKNKKQSFNLEQGDIFRIPAGIQSYMTNRDDKQELLIVKLLQPVALPNHFEVFHGIGGYSAESIHQAGLSWDVLEASFNTGRDTLKKVLGQNQEDFIVKATKHQIKELGPSALERGTWPFGSDRNGPFNLLNQKPKQSNEFGKLFEAFNEDYEPLSDLDVMVSFANITKGGMIGPFYNSRATKISFVVDGEGWFEMACPHLSGKTQEKGQRFPQNVRSPLKKGTVFVAPAGHPLVAVASKNKNLQILCFEVNAKGNIRFPLAGKNNVISLMDKEAKELSFNAPADVVDKVFNGRKEEFFFPGPKKGFESGHSSI